jgi:hypothetical protein
MSDFAQPVVSNNNIGIGTLSVVNGPSSSATSQIQDMPGEDNQQQQQQQQTTTSCKLTAGTDGTGRTLGPTDGKGTTTTTMAGGNNNGGGRDGESSGCGDGVGTEVTSTTVVLAPPSNGPLIGTGTVVVTTIGPLLLG